MAGEWVRPEAEGNTAHDGLWLAVCSSHYTWGFELGAQKA